MPFTSFSNDASYSKAEVAELNVRTGRDSGSFVYIMPPKYLALERGDGERFLQETSFSRTDSKSLPPPPSPLWLIVQSRIYKKKLI